MEEKAFVELHISNGTSRIICIKDISEIDPPTDEHGQCLVRTSKGTFTVSDDYKKLRAALPVIVI